MTHLYRTFWGWLLALTITVTVAFSHASFAGETSFQYGSGPSATMQQDLHQGSLATLDCHALGDSHGQAGGCAAMASHCASLLPQGILLPRQVYIVISVEYGFGVVAPRDVASARDTPPPRA